MTVSLVTQRIQNFIGTSSDVKPLTIADGAALPAGSTFTETDTGNGWLWDGVAWNEVGAETLVVLQLAATNQLVAVQNETLEILRDLRLEMVATRLASQERLNEGSTDQYDFREMAQSVIDAAETEEP